MSELCVMLYNCISSTANSMIMIVSPFWVHWPRKEIIIKHICMLKFDGLWVSPEWIKTAFHELCLCAQMICCDVTNLELLILFHLMTGLCSMEKGFVFRMIKSLEGWVCKWKKDCQVTSRRWPKFCDKAILKCKHTTFHWNKSAALGKNTPTKKRPQE